MKVEEKKKRGGQKKVEASENLRWRKPKTEWDKNKKRQKRLRRERRTTDFLSPTKFERWDKKKFT